LRRLWLFFEIMGLVTAENVLRRSSMGSKQKVVFIAVVLGILFVLMGGAVRASEDGADTWKDAPGAREYPLAGALVLLDEVDFSMDASGSTELIQHEVIKILNERGRLRYGVIRLSYDAATQEIDLLDARTILPDGKVVKPPQEAIQRESLPSLSEQGFSAYSNAKYLSVSMPAPVDGAILEYRVRIREKTPPMKSNFWAGSYMQDTEPVIISRFTVNVPEGISLNYQALNPADRAPEITREKGRAIYRWEVKDSPPLSQEASMPPVKDLVSQVRVTSVKNWEELSAWLWRRVENKIKPSGGVGKRASEIVKGKAGEEARVRALYNYVSGTIRDVDLDFSLSGYNFSSAEDVLNRRYGNSQDKAALLLAMLKSVNIKASPAFLGTLDAGKVIESLPSPDQYNRVIVALPRRDGILWMDPSSSDCTFGDLPPADQGRTALVLSGAGGRLVRTPIFPPEKNLEKTQIESRLSPEGSLDQVMIVEESGANSGLLRSIMKKLRPPEARQVFQSLVSQIADDARLVRYDVTGVTSPDEPLRIYLAFSADSYAGRASRSLALKLPVFTSLRMTSVIQGSLQERRYPVVLGNTNQEEKDLHIVFSPEYSLEDWPAEIHFENSIGSFEMTFRQARNEVWCHTLLRVSVSEVPVEKFSELKDLVETSLRAEQGVFILKCVQSPK